MVSLLDALIVAVPAPTKVTAPVEELTVATLVSLLEYERVPSPVVTDVVWVNAESDTDLLTEVGLKSDTVAAALLTIEPLVNVTAFDTAVVAKLSVPPVTDVVPVPSAVALPTVTVPEAIVTPPEKVLDDAPPIDKFDEEEVSFVRLPAPEITPLSVWFALDEYFKEAPLAIEIAPV